MRSVKSIQAAKAGYIVLSAVLCGLGLGLMLRPNMSIYITGTVVGAVMVAFGVIKLMGYFSRDLYRLAFQFDLAFGILLIALGAVILARPVRAMNMLCILLGVEIVADGLFKVQTALDARRFGLNSWWLIMLMAVITGIAGIVMAVNPTDSAAMLSTLTGAALVAQGVLNMIVALCAVKVVRHQKPEAWFEGEEG